MSQQIPGEAAATRVITIDGPAGTGKSTVARLLAERLGFGFLDTGAMYRAVAWKCLAADIGEQDGIAAARIAEQLRFQLDGPQLLINGENPGDQIRTSEVTFLSSRVAAIPAVRDVLVAQQRRIAEEFALVSEGRDQGTVVFPDAACKFFLTASPEVRAQRRYNDLKHKPDAPTLEQVLLDQNERDLRDQSREAAPLKPAADAEMVDTSDKSLEEVIDALEAVSRERLASS